MWARNNSRLRTSSNYYLLHDSYSMPSFLKNARAKYKDSLKLANSSSGHSVTRIDISEDATGTIGEEPNEFEGFEQSEERSSPNSFTTILRVIPYTLREAVIWIFHRLRGVWIRTTVDTPLNELNTLEGIRRLFNNGGHFKVYNSNDPGFGKEDFISIKSSDSETGGVSFFSNDDFVQAMHWVDKDEFQSSEINTYLLGPAHDYEVYEIFVQDKLDRNHANTTFDNLHLEINDFKTLILNEKCATLIWIISGQTRIVLMNETVESDKWNLQQWYRKVLADIALTDSIVTEKAYYWDQAVRQRLDQAVRQFKMMYKNIEMKNIKLFEKEGPGEMFYVWSQSQPQSSLRNPKLYQVSTKNGELKMSSYLYEEESQRKPTKVIIIGKNQKLAGRHENSQMIPIRNLVDDIFQQWKDAVKGHQVLDSPDEANTHEPENVFAEGTASVEEYIKTSKMKNFLESAGLMNGSTKEFDEDCEGEEPKSSLAMEESTHHWAHGHG